MQHNNNRQQMPQQMPQQMNKPQKMNKPQQKAKVVQPPKAPAKPADPPLSGYIVVISIENGGVVVHKQMPKNPSDNFYALNYNKQYEIDTDLATVKDGRHTVKAYNKRSDKPGRFNVFAKAVKTSTNIVFVNEQYDRELGHIEYVSFHQHWQEARNVPKHQDADNNEFCNYASIEARTANNKRAIVKGGNKWNLFKKAKSLGQKAAAFGQKLNENTKKAQQWAKEQFAEPQTGPSRQPPMIPNQMQQQKPLQPHQIQALYNQQPQQQQPQQQGGMPDLKKDAKNIVKWAMDLPERGYKSIQNKAKEIYKEIRGGDIEKAKKCCKQLEKLCKDKCEKQKQQHKQKQQKGGSCSVSHGGCKCGKNCKCGKKCKCGGNPPFDIKSKANQDFGKELEKQYNKKANPLKAQIKAIQAFKKQLKQLPESEFNNNLKSKKHMSNAQRKKEQLDRQDKKIAAKKQAIKDHEQKIYGMFR